MAYSKDIYDAARDELARRRHDAEAQSDMNLEMIRLSAPEIYEEEMLVRGTFYRLVRQMIGKGDSAAIDAIIADNTQRREHIKQMLKQRGYPEDHLDTKYVCPKCRDTGSIEGVNCECFNDLLKRLSARKLRQECTIAPRSFSDARTDIYEPDVIQNMQQIISYLQQYCQRFEGRGEDASLLFYGSTGTGKTFLSSCIATALTDRGFAVSIGSAFDLFKKAEEEQFKNTGGGTMQSLIESDLLIIDDLGSEFKTKFTEAVLYNMINSRMNLNKPTIVSTNMPMNDFKAAYNERITSRIQGTFIPIMFRGKDVRLKLSKVQ